MTIMGHGFDDMMRGNGPLPNVESFYSTFGLKEGDKMWLSSDKPVKIW
jgi:putative endopeptidase